MKPPPPMFPAVGWTTASAKPVAMAASTAFPPLASTSAPTSLAMRLADDTIPSCERRPRVGRAPSPARGASPPWQAVRATIRGMIQRDVEFIIRFSSFDSDFEPGICTGAPSNHQTRRANPGTRQAGRWY